MRMYVAYFVLTFHFKEPTMTEDVTELFKFFGLSKIVGLTPISVKTNEKNGRNYWPYLMVYTSFTVLVLVSFYCRISIFQDKTELSFQIIDICIFVMDTVFLMSCYLSTHKHASWNIFCKLLKKHQGNFLKLNFYNNHNHKGLKKILPSFIILLNLFMNCIMYSQLHMVHIIAYALTNISFYYRMMLAFLVSKITNVIFKQYLILDIQLFSTATIYREDTALKLIANMSETYKTLNKITEMFNFIFGWQILFQILSSSFKMIDSLVVSFNGYHEDTFLTYILIWYYFILELVSMFDIYS